MFEAEEASSFRDAAARLFERLLYQLGLKFVYCALEGEVLVV